MGIGPTYQPWEGCALPLSYARVTPLMIFPPLAGVNDSRCFATIALKIWKLGVDSILT